MNFEVMSILEINRIKILMFKIRPLICIMHVLINNY